MHVDFQPIIIAVAGLLLALTPVAVAWTNVQVQLLKLRLENQEHNSAVQGAVLGAKVDALAVTIRSTASTTQEQVRSERHIRAGDISRVGDTAPKPPS